MTNADKVRQMTDEGLLKWLDKIGYACMPDDRSRAWLGNRRTKTKPRRKKRK